MNTPLRSTLALALLSGAAALSHELLWTRRLIDLLGATGEATSRVFGCFFLGLAIGSIVAARWLPRINSHWRAVAGCEVAIALLSVPVITLPWWSDWVWPALGPELLVGWQGAAVKPLLSVAVVLPPAVPMGMTLPLFAAALLQGKGALSRQGVLLYGVNSLGGVVGLLVTSTVLLGLLGVVGSMMAAAATNLLVAALALVLHRKPLGDTPPPETKKQTRRAARQARKTKPLKQETPLGLRAALLLSFLSGLAMLTLEVLSIRMLGLAIPSSLQAAVAVLVSVILLLAIAAIAFPLLLKVHASPKNWLVLSLSGAALASSLAPSLFYRGSNELSQVTLPGGQPAATTTEFTLAVCALALSTIGPALLLGGMVLPAVFGWIGGEAGDRRGEGLGYLLAANGVGGILGAELTDLIVLPQLGIYAGFAAVGVLYALAVPLVLRPWAERSTPNLIASGVVVIATLCVGATLSSSIPYLNPQVAKVYKYNDSDTRFGREGVLLIIENEQQGRGILVNNQYVLGDTGFARDERREVLLPMLLHPQPKRVGCIGLATGISAGAALDYSAESKLTAVELSRLVTEAAAQHFSEFNGGLADNPRAQVVIEDGRTYLSAFRDHFDVIVGDLYRPYGAGEGRLFSVEHFRAARRALRDGGHYCQWLPMYQLTEEHFGIIAASFLKVFPDAELIRANHSADNPILGLVGCKEGRVDLTGLEDRCTALKSFGRVDDAELLSPERLRDFYLGRIDPQLATQYRLNTLDNALVELLAGQRRVTQNPRGVTADGQDPYLKGEAWDDFEDRLPEFLSE